jgi:hypothetical protein
VIDPERFYTFAWLKRTYGVRRAADRAARSGELRAHDLDGRGPRVQGAEWLRWLESRRVDQGAAND